MIKTNREAFPAILRFNHSNDSTMKKATTLFLALTASLLIGATAQIYEPIRWHVEQKPTGNGTADLYLRATIDEGWHLYGLQLPEGGPLATSIVFSTVSNARLVGEVKALSALHHEYDANFDMELNWYSGEAVFVQSIAFDRADAVRIEGHVEYMACNDQTCLPPAEAPFAIGHAPSGDTAPAATPKPAAPHTIAALPLTPASLPQADTPADHAGDGTPSKYWTPVVDELQALGESRADDFSLGWIFLVGMLGGLLALLTPCVWPIIPMTVSFFLKRAEDKARGRRDAMLYGAAILIIYVGLGLLITLLFGASALNDLSTNAVFNIFLFALLVVFAVSFFGAFEITLPANWTTRMDAKANSTAGFVSLLFMAFTLVLVSFSCTGPIIGFLLVEVSGSGSMLAPLVGMAGFAVALAVPFSLFAFFPTWLKSLPKSGGWLNRVKVVLAFVELAFALKFLSVADLAYGWGLLDREVFIVLWVVIFALLGFYLLGKLRFPHDTPSEHTGVGSALLAILSLAFALYLVPGLWGAPLKAVSAFLPPLYTQDFNLNTHVVEADFTDYDEGMRHAERTGKPVLVDFSGYGCVNCRKMEAKVWTDPRVMDVLERDYVLITLYVDDKTPLPAPYEVEEGGRTRHIRTVGDRWSYLQRHKFGSNAQPFYVLLTPDGQPLNRSYAYDEDPAKFLEWLREGIERNAQAR